MQDTRLITLFVRDQHGEAPFGACLRGPRSREAFGASPCEAIGRLLIEAPEFHLRPMFIWRLLPERVEDTSVPLDDRAVDASAETLGRLAMNFPDVYHLEIEHAGSVEP